MSRASAAIVGIGHTAFARDLGQPERRTALAAIRAALDDAGLAPSDVDGLVRFDLETTSEVEVARNLGIPNLRFFAETGYGGGGGCAAVGLAAMAIATGRASVVVCWRARHRGSGGRPWAATGGRVGGDAQFSVPYGIVRPVDQIALLARRHMHEYGTTAEHFGAVAVACRKHASRNPHALMREPITLADHRASRFVCEPLRKLDCCLETDGGVAVVVTSRERARDLAQRPALVLAAAQGTGPEHYVMTSYHAPRPLATPSTWAARDLFAAAGVAPGDVDVAQIYDVFTPLVVFSLEEYGFCAAGEGGPFCEGGRIEWPDGALPVNTSGGGLSEAYLHGMNLVAEGVRQLRGASSSQVADAELCLVTSGAGVPTSALLLAAA
ncbi:MAG: lipid-transfer protein [Proteobacteria bacterium]|nr:MAG: lipid-transfer protein [Pseudomonadota bacterium]